MGPRSRAWRAEGRALVRLAAPVVVVQVGLMSMGMVDTLMVGHLSSEALAAVAIGSYYCYWFLSFGMGVLMALDPLVAQAVGARDEPAVARALQRGVVLAILMSLPLAAFLLAAGPVLGALRQPAELLPTASSYAIVSMGSVPGFLLFVVLRQTLQALHRMRAIVLTVVLANLANVFANWLLIFGHGGFPALGAVGTAWATLVVRTLMVPVLVIASWSSLRPYVSPLLREAARLGPVLQMVRLGLPIGAQHLLEIGAFSAVALLMGWLGTEAIAAHQIAINLAAFSFMMPLGVSAAAAVRVGHAVGRQDETGARKAAVAALVLGGLIMAGWAVVYGLVPELLAGFYTNEAPLILLAASLIQVAAVFQVFDGLQVVSIGILRGTGDTRTPMIVAVIGFYGVTLPLSYGLGFGLGRGATGLWWGLVAGLAAVAVVLLVRVRARLGAGIDRLDLGEADHAARA